MQPKGSEEMGIDTKVGTKDDWVVLKRFYDYLMENYSEFKQIIKRDGNCKIEYKPENVYSYQEVKDIEGKNWDKCVFSTIFEEDLEQLDCESRNTAMRELTVLYPIYVFGGTVLRKDEVRQFFKDYSQEISSIELNRVLSYNYNMVKNISEVKISTFFDNSSRVDVVSFKVSNLYNPLEDDPKMHLFIADADGKGWSTEIRFSNIAGNMLTVIINCFRLMSDKSVIHIYNEGENPVARVLGISSMKYKYGDNVTVDKFLRDLVYYIKGHCNKPIKELYVLGNNYTKFRVRKNFDEEYTMTVF